MSEAVAPPPTPGLTDEELQDRLRIQVVDASDAVQANAIDSAEAHLEEHTTQRGIKGYLKRIWQGNIARDYIRQREVMRGRQEIIRTGNIYSLVDGDQDAHNAAMAAVVERFTSEHIHEQAGETNQNFEDAEHANELTAQLQQAVLSYARGDLDSASLLEERTRILAEYGRQVNQNDRNRGLIFADNLLEVAENARFAFEHEVGLDRIEAAIGGRLGEASTGVRSQARLDATDRILNRLHGTRVGRTLERLEDSSVGFLRIGALVNETTIAAGVAIAMTASKFTVKKGTTALAAFVGLGVGAGLIAGYREHVRVGQERTTHSREMAEGGEIAAGSNRRERMEETRYETAAAEQLITDLQAAREAYEAGDSASLDDLIQLLTAARIRIDASDQRSMDLISYDSKTSVEAQRLALDIEIARAGIAVDEAVASGETTADLEAIRSTIDSAIIEDISAKDRAFKSLRFKRTLKMGAIGAATGMIAGLGIQELHALFDGGLQGIHESFAGTNRQSLLNHWFGEHGHNTPANHVHDWHREPFEGGHHLHDTAVDMPPGYDLVKVHDGQKFGWEIHDAKGNNVLDKLDWDKWQELVGNDPNENHLHHIREGHTGVGFDTQGNLDHDTRMALRELGWKLDNQHHIKFHQSETVTNHVERSPHEFLSHHPGQFTDVHRQLWYDNNTPGVYDQNELKLWWGGSTGTGVDSDGNYVFNVAHMGPDGSYHQGFSADAPQLVNNGHMKIALSMTKDTQTHVFMVDVDKNGNGVIPHDSYIGRSLFENQNGRAHFTGAYAEAIQELGTNPDGSENVRMLATVVGDNNPNSASDVVHHVVSREHTHFVTHIEAPVEAGTPIEVPPVLPIYGRRGLEALSYPELEGTPSYYGYEDDYDSGYYGPGGESLDRPSAPYARELETNPDAEVDANKVAKRYFEGLSSSHKKIIDKLTQDLEKQPKAAKPKAVIMIPAAAHQEGKNIYRTFEQYAKQQDIDNDSFEVVIFANNPIGTKRDQTVNEVRRFQAAYPDIKVRLIEKRLEPKEAKMGWIRKAATDTVIADLIKRDVDLNDVIFVSNDADSLWIDPRYISTLIKKSEQQKDADGFLGFVEWDYDAYKAYPQELVATRFMQMIDIYQRVKKHRVGSSGANFAYRPGIYMAVGGYKPGSGLAEDVQLGRMIKSVRAGSDTRRPIGYLGRSSEIRTSSRRALETLFKSGGAPIKQWSSFGPYDSLRTKEFDLKNFNFNDRDAVQELVKDTERMLNQTLDVFRPSIKDETSDTYEYGRIHVLNSESMRNINRMLATIGVKVKWYPNGSFRIVDAGRMIYNLRRWQAAH